MLTTQPPPSTPAPPSIAARPTDAAAIDPTPRPPWRRLRAPAVATAVLQAVLVLGDRMPSIDALAYFDVGRNVLAGRGYVRHGAPEHHFPPVAPLAYGVLERVTGSEMGALRAWNLAWGLATVALLTAIAWVTSRDDDATVATAWIATCIGGLVCLGIRGGSGSELATTSLTLAAALLLLVAISGRDRHGPLWTAGLFAAAGATVGVAYLTRPEALLVAGPLVLVASIHLVRGAGPARWRQTGLAAAAFAVALVVCVAPYVLHQHGQTGSWALTSKARDASVEAWRSVAEGDRLARDQVLYAVQPDGETLGPHTEPLTHLAVQHPGAWAGIVAVNLRTFAELYLLWQIIPVFLLVPAIGRLCGLRRTPAAQLFATVAAVPVLTCLVFFTLPRYLMTTTAVLIPFGVCGATAWLRERSPAGRRRGWIAIGALGLVSLQVASWPLLPGSPGQERTEQRTAGRWIADHTPADARIMTRSYHVQGYAEREVVALPTGGIDVVLAYARRMGAAYLVADEPTIRGRRPELAEALLGPDVPTGLVLVHQFTERGRTVRIFALDPAPAPGTGHAVPLGYVSD